MRLVLLSAVVGLAALLAACDSNTVDNSCPGTGLVTVVDSVVGTGQEASGSFVASYVGRLAATGDTFDVGTRVQFSSTVAGFRQGVTGRAATGDAPAIAPMRANGGIRRIFVPANFGYRRTGVPDVIPSCADLIFDVELIDP